MVLERETNLRYVLNFIGIRSSAYYLGNMMAELIIFAGISVTLIILSLILGLDAINKASWLIYIHMIAFGWAFIPFNYTLSFLFNKAETN
jgi:hypothetical protein